MKNGGSQLLMGVQKILRECGNTFFDLSGLLWTPQPVSPLVYRKRLGPFLNLLQPLLVQVFIPLCPVAIVLSTTFPSRVQGPPRFDRHLGPLPYIDQSVANNKMMISC